MSDGAVGVAVVVASRDRPLRLRWLLNALSEQSAAAGRFEVVVAFDPACAQTASLLRTHRLRGSGRLRTVPFPPGSGFPGAGRNAAWRASDAPLILFTDDDCRPDRDWIARARAAALGHPGAIIQGRTVPDPDEAATLLGAPWTETMLVTPPTFWAPTCNVAYPRSVLEGLGGSGFDESLRVGEDTDLAVRARRAGTPLVAAPEMLVYHAVQERWLGAMLVAKARWRDLAALAARHPEVRGQLWGAIWWKREHAALVAALAGAAVGRRRRPLAVASAGPWLALALRHNGFGARGLLRSLSELPGRAATDLAEILALARGSVRYRTLML